MRFGFSSIALTLKKKTVDAFPYTKFFSLRLGDIIYESTARERNQQAVSLLLQT